MNTCGCKVVDELLVLANLMVGLRELMGLAVGLLGDFARTLSTMRKRFM